MHLKACILCLALSTTLTHKLNIKVLSICNSLFSDLMHYFTSGFSSPFHMKSPYIKCKFCCAIIERCQDCVLKQPPSRSVDSWILQGSHQSLLAKTTKGGLVLCICSVEWYHCKMKDAPSKKYARGWSNLKDRFIQAP